MTDDLVEWLSYARKRAHSWRLNTPEGRPKEVRCMEALADRIEALTAENERLREALELITREGGLAEYRIARAALTGDDT